MLPIITIHEYYNNDNAQPTHHDFQNVVEFEVIHIILTVHRIL